MELDYNAIGVRIRRLRKELGLTQQALAELSNQEPSNISHIERGATKLSLPTIVNIANALGVTVDDLLCDSLQNATSTYSNTASNLLNDCSHEELIFMTETMRAIKDNLRKNITSNT
ncbi:DNA-binding transcriptional regulator, XRE-family HTH domain [Pseudobutyrivibrio sp. OR37]|uniref:helix-turn-helix domain-containing protein n=1 Tax=Pseudobutyrivibrio sp. OR37 TaxID=1798186 RepID=UPI0008F2F0CF|nr:helix-turn-helix transcriptional regulator [Pseudobutyrivibrio sp. OR37]SFH54433.1 DNA-binding transcriptional regulator, XRE-family HTH domain [Pseudobutyrivibrio sp. OR37]